jgi:hypothetical protein
MDTSAGLEELLFEAGCISDQVGNISLSEQPHLFDEIVKLPVGQGLSHWRHLRQ